VGVVLLALVVLAGMSAVYAQPVPPDAPRPAPPEPKTQRSAGGRAALGPVELKDVVVGRVTGRYATLAGAEFMKTARDPIYIEVQTVTPLGNLARDSAPVILLNDQRLKTTRAIGADRLVAILPDRDRLKDVNTVAVEWVGERPPTKSPRPLTFRREDVPK
jgi:hypothetical protein